jgi:hypothetical protein
MGEKSHQLSAFRRQIRSVGLFSVVSHSAFALFILRVGWFERSETQQIHVNLFFGKPKPH